MADFSCLSFPDACFLVACDSFQRNGMFASQADKELLRKALRDTSRDMRLAVLGYVLMADHYHVILPPSSFAAVTQFIEAFHRQGAQQVNHRQRRGGNVWAHRYSVTLCQQSTHLHHAMLYLDTHPVRRQLAAHPDQWPYCGYQETIGRRQRYKTIDLQALATSLRLPTIAAVRQNYQQSVEKFMAQQPQVSQPHWTQATAVGTPAWVDRITEAMPVATRRKVIQAGSHLASFSPPGHAPVDTAALYLSCRARHQFFHCLPNN